MRFQAFNLPPGLNSMPDLGTIALAVQQQGQEAAQQRQQQQEEWRLQQQRQQLARQSAANRHLQLYQLGVMQQRARLQQGSSLVGPACVTAASYRSQAQPTLQQQQQLQHQQQQQQPCGEACQGSTVMEQQRQQQQQEQEEAALGPQQDNLERHVRFSSAGQGDAAQAAAAGAEPAAAPSKETAVAQVAVEAEVHAATGTAGPCSDGIESGNSKQQQQAGQTCGNAVLEPNHQQQQQQQHIHPQHAISVANCSQAVVAAPGSKGMNSIASTVLLQPLASDEAGMPPQRCHKSDVPGAAGASHGHLSPAGLTFNHLPGSRRQVGQVQLQHCAIFATSQLATFLRELRSCALQLYDILQPG
jgi:hypothetical protein